MHEAVSKEEYCRKGLQSLSNVVYMDAHHMDLLATKLNVKANLP
jgi:hypothetical protein